MCELCVLIISNFLAVLWAHLSYFLDYVDKIFLSTSSKILVCRCFIFKVKKTLTKFQTVGPNYFI